MSLKTMYPLPWSWSRWLFLSSVIAFLTGCAGLSSRSDRSLDRGKLMDAYLSQVAKYDGINREEAIVLAQSQVIFRGREREFVLEEPQVTSSPELWTVTFIPVNRTLVDILSRPEIKIHIRKANGEVIWQEE